MRQTHAGIWGWRSGVVLETRSAPTEPTGVAPRLASLVMAALLVGSYPAGALGVETDHPHAPCAPTDDLCIVQRGNDFTVPP